MTRWVSDGQGLSFRALAALSVEHLTPEELFPLAYEFSHAAALVDLWPCPFYGPDLAPKNNRFHGIGVDEARYVYNDTRDLYSRLNDKTGRVVMYPHMLDKPHTCSVYVVQCQTTSHIKIGSSVSPEHRLVSLQIGSASRLSIVRTYRGDKALEGFLHGCCKQWKIHGEWFAVAALGRIESVIDAIANPFGAERPTNPPRVPRYYSGKHLTRADLDSFNHATNDA